MAEQPCQVDGRGWAIVICAVVGLVCVALPGYSVLSALHESYLRSIYGRCRNNLGAVGKAMSVDANDYGFMLPVAGGPSTESGRTQSRSAAPPRMSLRAERSNLRLGRLRLLRRCAPRNDIRRTCRMTLRVPCPGDRLLVTCLSPATDQVRCHVDQSHNTCRDQPVVLGDLEQDGRTASDDRPERRNHENEKSPPGFGT